VPRAKKKPGEKKDNTVRIRLTDEQKKVIEAAAQTEGMDLSTFGRVAMLERARRSPSGQ
jgi:uncharacterized protein (DUF1778 family)